MAVGRSRPRAAFKTSIPHRDPRAFRFLAFRFAPAFASMNRVKKRVIPNRASADLIPTRAENLLSISMAYNVITYKKIKRNTKKIKIADFREGLNGKKRFLSGIARISGGSTHARIFWPSIKKCIFGQ